MNSRVVFTLWRYVPPIGRPIGRRPMMSVPPMLRWSMTTLNLTVITGIYLFILLFCIGYVLHCIGFGGACCAGRCGRQRWSPVSGWWNHVCQRTLCCWCITSQSGAVDDGCSAHWPCYIESQKESSTSPQFVLAWIFFWTWGLSLEVTYVREHFRG